MFKNVFRATQGLEIFYVALLGLFSRRYAAKKQVGAQSSFWGVELLENLLQIGYRGPPGRWGGPHEKVV